MTIRISCNCGAVKVALKDEPLDQFYCHCKDCQAVSGGAYVAAAVYDRGAVELESGTLDTWTLKTMPRQRCNRCGTHMLARVSEELTGIKADRLPQGDFKPEFHINCASAVLPVADALPHFADLPASWGGSGKQTRWSAP